MMEGIDYRLKTTKAKYLDAKNWLIEKWKAARAAAGFSTKPQTKGRASKKARVSDASELVTERSKSTDAQSVTSSTESTRKQVAASVARKEEPARKARVSDASEAVETASVISADSKRSVKSKQSMIKKSAKIVKPKVKKVVPPSTPPNPGLTTQQISGEFL